jgi:hypothetical protein
VTSRGSQQFSIWRRTGICEAKTVARRKLRSLALDQHHEKAKNQEGKIGQKNTNHGLLTQIDSGKAEDPEDG